MLITGKSVKVDFKDFKNVLGGLQKFGFNAKFNKCCFFQKSVIFCRIKTFKNWVHKAKEKIEAVALAL